MAINGLLLVNPGFSVSNHHWVAKFQSGGTPLPLPPPRLARFCFDTHLRSRPASAIPVPDSRVTSLCRGLHKLRLRVGVRVR